MIYNPTAVAMLRGRSRSQQATPNSGQSLARLAFVSKCHVSSGKEWEDAYRRPLLIVTLVSQSWIAQPLWRLYAKRILVLLQ